MANVFGIFNVSENDPPPGKINRNVEHGTHNAIRVEPEGDLWNCKLHRQWIRPADRVEEAAGKAGTAAHITEKTGADRHRINHPVQDKWNVTTIGCDSRRPL
jgi:hypothetical protein